jgi:hypothetical protein
MINGRRHRTAVKNALSETNASQNTVMELTIHHGIIKMCTIEGTHSCEADLQGIRTALLDKKVQDVPDWGHLLDEAIPNGRPVVMSVGKWLNDILPVVQVRGS